MKNSRKICSVLVLFVFISISFQWSFLLNQKESVNLPEKRIIDFENHLKTSAAEITILNPENKTYTEPMSGYYPGTYDFQDEPVGNNIEEIRLIDSDLSDSKCGFDIVSEYLNHKKVLKCVDGSGKSQFYGIHYFENATSSGTIEFWYALNNTGINNGMGVRIYGDTFVWYINCWKGYWRSNGWVGMGYASANTWYHIKMEYNCTIDEVKYYIDGDLKRTLNIPGMDQIDYMTIDSDPNYFTSMSGYLDAIGFSWDEQYETGDNLYEGLQLSFNNNNFEWMGYSLDATVNKTIYGNKTLSLPNNGGHNIQVFGKNSSGIEFSSEKRFFTIDIAPELSWVSPNDNRRIYFPKDNNIFHFQFQSNNLVNVTLTINGIKYGSVWNKNSIDLPEYNSSIDGSVTAILDGYEEGNPNPTISDSRNFIFAKVLNEISELQDYGVEFIGEKLYLILHDPPGDHSFSGYIKSTSLSIGINSKFSQSHGLGIEVDGSLFGVGVEASANIKATSGVESQYEFTVTDITELVSSLESSNRDYIGPGYGDKYWGEAISYNWQLRAPFREYYNTTERYELPRIYWGLSRSSEVFIDDKNAPNVWRDLNPVHNNWTNVEWIDNHTVIGQYNDKHLTTKSTKQINSFQINIDSSVKTKFPTINLTYNLELEWQNQEEQGREDKYELSYRVEDDEPTDIIMYDYGIDKLFSTFIFKTIPDSMTSNPLEHDTFDYVPPILDFPKIEYDSSGDGISPCLDDEPIVEVKIADEGGIHAAWINYSAGNGIWGHVNLYEQAANPGYWEGYLPTYAHGTKIDWYIVAWDNELSKSIRKDPHGRPFSYTVINRIPIVNIISPNGGEIFRNSVEISWSANDPDDDALSYTLAYNDGGFGWYLIATAIVDNTYQWDITNIPHSKSILIRVIAEDGFGGSGEDMSDFLFTIGEAGFLDDPLAQNITLLATQAGITTGLIGLVYYLLSKKVRTT